MSSTPGDRHKLFRAVVVLGAALTSPSCDDTKCLRCVPPVDAAADAPAVADAGVDGQGPSDAPVDVVLIL